MLLLILKMTKFGMYKYIVISFAGSVHESRRIKQELEDLVSSLDMTMPLPVLSTEELSHRGRLAGTRQTAQTTLRAQQ